MNKQDWLRVFVKILGVYFVAANIPTLLTTAFTLIKVLTQNATPALTASTVYLWQGPISSALAICVGLLLLSLADPIVRILQKDDEE